MKQESASTSSYKISSYDSVQQRNVHNSYSKQSRAAGIEKQRKIDILKSLIQKNNDKDEILPMSQLEGFNIKKRSFKRNSISLKTKLKQKKGRPAQL